MAYSEIELAALEEKAVNPNKVVLCPRCGKELTYKSVGNSYQVKCTTEKCLIETCRGL